MALSLSMGAGGVIVPRTEAAKYNELIGSEHDNLYLDISDDLLMAPTHQDLQETGTINHSCDPNVGFQDAGPVKKRSRLERFVSPT